MTRLKLYGILTLIEILLGLAYGFLWHNRLPVDYLLAVAFCVAFTVLFVFPKSQRKTLVKLIESLVLSLLLMAVSLRTLEGVNRLHAELIGEYDVVVEIVYGRGGGSATFTTPLGNEGSVDLHDYRPIVFDDEEHVVAGDTIRVREYKGLFNEVYYIFVEEVS